MKVARLLIYDGPEDLVLKQLGASLPDGVRSGLHGGVTITVCTIRSKSDVEIQANLARVELVEASEMPPVPIIPNDYYQAQARRGEFK